MMKIRRLEKRLHAKRNGTDRNVYPTGCRRGMTLMEMVVAITIVLIIMTGVVWSFIELLDSHDQARARMEATANARAAMEVLSKEIKRAKNTTGTLGATFIGQTTSNAGGGDLLDKDEDGSIDEEILNGEDDDGDWDPPPPPTSDKHALIPSGGVTYAERPVFFQDPDLDDANIDEDIGATSATVEFDTFNAVGEPLDRRVRFYIGQDADGTPNTLMQEVIGTDSVTSTTVMTSGPVCYNVVSFGLLFWDHSLAKDSDANPWQMSWPPAASPDPPLTVSPSSVYLTISVYAGTPLGLEELDPGTPLETVTLTTIVNVEAVLAHPSYFAQRTPVTPVAASP